MKTIKIILSILFLVQSLFVFAQDDSEDKELKKNIVLNFPDSVVKFQVLLAPREITAGELLQFFWYDSDKVKTRKGSYSGKLLDGQYRVFGKEENLLVEGSFFNGLQHGVWKRWDAQGNLIRQAEWNEGLKDGILEVFSKKGEKLLYQEFKEGQLHGKQVTFKDSKEHVVYFIKGELSDKESFEKVSK